MRRAIQIAAENAATGGGPFGALVVRGDEVVAEGANQVTSQADPTAHAEIVAIRRACRALGTFQLSGCEIYASCEPCPMCLGAVYWSRPERLLFAATRADAAAAGFDDEFVYHEMLQRPESRRLATVRVLPVEGQQPFRIWLRNRDRTPY